MVLNKNNRIIHWWITIAYKLSYWIKQYRLVHTLSLIILFFIKTKFLLVSVINVMNIKVILIILPCVVFILFIAGTTKAVHSVYGPHINFYCKSRGLLGGLPKMSKYVKFSKCINNYESCIFNRNPNIIEFELGF